MDGSELEKAGRRYPVSIEAEMKSSYMDYAMSVIIGRALPDVRDGLKPVHRRILYSMYELGNEWNKPYKKSARVVGDVIGKYHPHGDAAVYDALVRMAQDFSMRMPLVDGQGNFGSIDGDPPAAMRYTEVRMAKVAQQLLADLAKETVDFVPNYDGTQKEPLVLPTRVPNLLVNGSSGIAVGMATNIPPHNLVEVCDAAIMLIKKPSITLDELMEIIPGPDFPTGAFIYGRAGIKEAYTSGRGVIKLRARAFIEKEKHLDKKKIIVTEIPFQQNKARLIEKIAELVKDKRIEGISDVRDESDREGLRVAVELKRDAVPEVVLNQLFKHTSLQTSFGVTMLAIVGKRPKVMGLKEMLHEFVQHRREVVTKRCIFELRKAEERAHILEGLKIALENIDEVVALIKKASSVSDARESLMQRFSLTKIQSQAILDMKLQRLTALEQDKLINEYNQVQEEIAKLKKILADERLLFEIIINELKEVRDKFGNDRRSEIIDEEGELSVEDLIAEEEMVVTVSHQGYIKRNPISMYRAQRRGGRGKTGMATKSEDFVEDLFIATTHSYILVFTDLGRVYWLKVHEIPQAGRAAKGKAIVNLVNLQKGENVSAILPVKAFEEDHYVLMATENGIIKKTKLMAYSNPRSTGIVAALLDKGDRLVSVRLTDGSQDVFLGTMKGKSIRFREEQVRDTGRATRGVKGIELEQGDKVVGMGVFEPGSDLTILTACRRGYGKRTVISEYPVQSRAGKGVITIKTTERNGKVIGFLKVMEEDHIMFVTRSGVVMRTIASDISKISRNTQGVRLIKLDEDDELVALARLAEKDNGAEEGENGND
ncbi:MAG: DNA gyrase subunit A [Deltaproteobacteria bacterium]|nr:DNA gyrase subunit A [Deltaproteobacteria bacterium]